MQTKIWRPLISTNQWITISDRSDDCSTNTASTHEQSATGICYLQNSRTLPHWIASRMDYQSVTANLCRAGTSSSLWYLWGTSEYSAETEKETTITITIVVYYEMSSSPLSASITDALFHSKLKTYIFNKSFPPYLYFFTHWTAFMTMGLDQTYHTHQFIFSLYRASAHWRTILI